MAASRDSTLTVLLIPQTASLPRADWFGAPDERPLAFGGFDQAKRLAGAIGSVDATVAAGMRSRAV